MNILRITGLLLLYILFSSKGCDDRAENVSGKEIVLKAEQDSIKDTFQSDYLTEASLRAFEENAKQKLTDFADYFRILADTGFDASFRNQARNMIRELYYSENAEFELTLPGKPGSVKVTLEELLNDKFISRYSKTELTVDSVRVSEALHPDGNSGYTGMVSFRQGFRSKTGKEAIVAEPSLKKCVIVVAKHPKLFGKDTLEVWEVFLGNVY